MVGLLGKFCRDERGATAIEYALIASIVSVIIIGSLLIFQDSLVALYSDISDSVTNPGG